jgi:hypothetical protein
MTATIKAAVAAARMKIPRRLSAFINSPSARRADPSGAPLTRSKGDLFHDPSPAPCKCTQANTGRNAAEGVLAGRVIWTRAGILTLLSRFLRVRKSRDKAVSLPNLAILAVCKLPRFLDCFSLVGTFDALDA